MFCVGISGFPRGGAETEKQKLISKIFLTNGYEVSVICSRNYFDGYYPYKGCVDGINYFYTTYTYSRKGPIENRIRQFFGKIIEKVIILKKRPEVVLIFSMSFIEILGYFLICKLIRSKMFLVYVEDLDSIIHKPLNNYLFHKLVFNMMNGVLPISEFLMDKVKSNSPNSPIFKLPVLVDMDVFNIGNQLSDIKDSFDFNYYLYCGGTAYVEVIEFVISAYLLSKVKSKLILVVSGHLNDIENIRKKYASENIIVLNGLKFKDLVYLYSRAKGLLIPLRENDQDKSRFPHKIGEYCASGNIIITNNWGEINKYFIHMDNAYICNHYNLKEFVLALLFVEKNKEISKEIGLKSKQLGYKYFDYKMFKHSLIDFIDRN